MSLEQLKAFLEHVKLDSDLQKKLKAAKTSQEVLDLAKDLEYEFTANHLETINADELELLAGGVGCLWRTLNCCANSGVPSAQGPGVHGPIDPPIS